MANSYDLEKNRLQEYLTIKRIEKGNDNCYRCPNPAHIDDKPSAVYYKTGKTTNYPVLWCPVCDDSWSIFEIAGLLDGLKDFKDKLKSVRQSLGIHHDEQPVKKKKEKNPQPFPSSESDKINKKIMSLATEKKWGENVASWKYHDIDGNVIALDVRFEREGERKNIITFWYDGTLKWYGAPIFIYNMHMLKKDTPIIIHEGAKCADLGNECLDTFILISISWSGGAGKAHMADWSLLDDRDVFILPDDDEPGLKAAKKIQKQLPHAKIIKPVEKAREIKQKGADIIEILQIMSHEELETYILNPDNHFESSNMGLSENEQPQLSEILPSDSYSDGPISDDSVMPFKILGIGDDGRAAFITEAGRLEQYKLETLAKNKLFVLANRMFWKSTYKTDDGKISWDWAIDEIIRLTQKKDFNDSNIRGRGAWRDGDKISYHDGINTHGEYCDKKIYLRLPKHDIGITEQPASKDLPKKIKELIFKMSFETPADAVRCLGWSTLAPFAGALKYRPALLLTGSSGSGKTTVANMCIRELADCEWFNGSESTVAGVRGKIKFDSRGIMFDETEADTMKKKANRDDLFSLMRVNVSDDAPDTVKGTKEGGYNSFKMQNMFGFIAIDPTVDSIADENRIFRVNMIKPQNGDNWKSIEESLIKLLTKKNCDAIRALTWQKLKIILKLSERIVDAIRKMTQRDYRSSFSDAMLASAFMVIWTGTDNPIDEQINTMLTKYYSYQPVEEHRDEAEEIIERLMDEKIEILGDHDREKITIMECLNRIYTDDQNYTEPEITRYKQHLSRYGLKIIDVENIAIANRHHEITHIINKGSGYNKILKRHKGFIEGHRSVRFLDGKSRWCTVLKGILNKDVDEDRQLEVGFK